MDGEAAGRVRGLLERAKGMEYGQAQVTIAEDAVRLADLHGDAELGFEAREVLIWAANFSGLGERTIAPFTWCLAQSDRDPRKFPADHISWRSSLLWQYKWIVGTAEDWPQVPLERLHAMLDDMEHRHRRHGYSDRPTLKHRLSLAIHRGDAEEAQALFPRWLFSTRDSLSDCPACERGYELNCWIDRGEDERAWERAAPIIDGRMSCSTVPRTTFAHLLMPLVRLGRLAEAVQCHLKGFRLSARNPKWTMDAHHHLRFLALTDHLTKATRLLESHFPYPHDPIVADRVELFHFFLSSRFLMERLRASGRRTIKLRLPEAFPAHRPEGRYEVAALEAWFDSEATRIAARFDARNRTDAFARRIEESRSWKDLVSPYPLRPPQAAEAAIRPRGRLTPRGDGHETRPITLPLRSAAVDPRPALMMTPPLPPEPPPIPGDGPDDPTPSAALPEIDLTLETDPRFPSGPWIGFFLMKPSPLRHEQELGLTFRQGTMTGEGRDRIGKFLVRGRYTVEDGKCWWTKSYIGRHDVFYHGYNEGKGIWGLWEIPPAYEGGFHIWPLAMGDPTHPHLAEALDIPAEPEAQASPEPIPEALPGVGVEEPLEVGVPA